MKRKLAELISDSVIEALEEIDLVQITEDAVREAIQDVLLDLQDEIKKKTEDAIKGHPT